VKRLPYKLHFVVILAALSSCSSYKQNIMLKTPEDFKSAPISKEILQAERNYVIQKNDRLELEVYTNKENELSIPIRNCRIPVPVTPRPT